MLTTLGFQVRLAAERARERERRDEAQRRRREAQALAGCVLAGGGSVVAQGFGGGEGLLGLRADGGLQGRAANARTAGGGEPREAPGSSSQGRAGEAMPTAGGSSHTPRRFARPGRAVTSPEGGTAAERGVELSPLAATGGGHERQGSAEKRHRSTPAGGGDFTSPVLRPPGGGLVGGVLRARSRSDEGVITPEAARVLEEESPSPAKGRLIWGGRSGNQVDLRTSLLHNCFTMTSIYYITV